ncbi:hypothetical protein [Ruegeria meonggei]|uniref:hypothetical protein n=1 Tax=Ruegeria meonggei TaxID=1446476 RepID=UPI0036712C0A
MSRNPFALVSPFAAVLSVFGVCCFPVAAEEICDDVPFQVREDGDFRQLSVTGFPSFQLSTSLGCNFSEACDFDVFVGHGDTEWRKKFQVNISDLCSSIQVSVEHGENSHFNIAGDYRSPFEL